MWKCTLYLWFNCRLVGRNVWWWKWVEFVLDWSHFFFFKVVVQYLETFLFLLHLCLEAVRQYFLIQSVLPPGTNIPDAYASGSNDQQVSYLLLTFLESILNCRWHKTHFYWKLFHLTFSSCRLLLKTWRCSLLLFLRQVCLLSHEACFKFYIIHVLHLKIVDF